MSRGVTVCNERGCPELVGAGANRCPAHARAAWTGSTRRDATLTKEWRRLRARIMRRDQGICYLCGKPGADTVDHKVPVSQGGTDDPSNLGAVHDRNAPHCHRAKSAREGRANR